MNQEQTERAKRNADAEREIREAVLGKIKLQPVSNFDNRSSFAHLGFVVGADTCWTGLEYSLEIPGMLDGEGTLRIVRWCGVRDFGFEIVYNATSKRTFIRVFAEVKQKP